MWWHVWSNHPTSTILCGCGDTSQFVWFLEWPAYALSHGLNPFYSTAAAYPHGVNLLSITSMLAVGIPLAPITWIFGPIATLNVALTLSPVLSGLAMFILLRRWVSWDPAAFIGGLLYGFSPLILTALDYSHLNLTISPIPPLVVACLDEIVIRQRRRPVATGVLLGLLVTLQFFLSTELLVIIALAGTFGLVLVTAYAAWRRPQALRRHARFAVVALAAGAIVAVVLLAYPAWFALAGPAHVLGLVWTDPGQYVSTLKSYLIPKPALRLGWLFGFDGVLISGQYLGLGLVVVLLGGLVAWRRDLRLWFFAIVGLAFLTLSLGAANPLFGFLPVLENILPNRFDQVVYLSAAIMLGIVVDHSYASVTRWYTAARSGVGHPEAPPVEGQARRINPGTTDRAHKPWVGWAGALAGLTVAGIALVPIGFYLFQNVPIPVQSSPHVPSWFRTAARHLGPKQVLLVLPDNLSVESALIWQVADGMRYAMVDEVGSSGTAAIEPAGLTVLADASLPASYGAAPPPITPGKIAAVRSALHEWGVTMVVIPDQPGLVPLAQISSVPAAAALITAATGQRPVYEEGAWVWAAINHASPSIVTTTSKFSECTSVRSRGTAAVDAAVACIASKGPFLRIVTEANGLDLLRNRVLMTRTADTVAVTRVEFVITGKDIFGSLTVPAHRFVYGSLEGWLADTDAMSLPNGNYALRSVAYDAVGAIGRSVDVRMRVDNETSPLPPPVTRVVKPAAHAQLSGPTLLDAIASSGLGVSNVEFRITGDGRTIIERAVLSLYGWLAHWNTRSVPNGTYTVYSVADGNTGLVTTSKGVVVEVRN
jgi:hypothetical protein